MASRRLCKTHSKSKWVFYDGLVSEENPNKFTRTDLKNILFSLSFEALNLRLFGTLDNLSIHSCGDP